jgi:glycosyltransferase involved in cell wall biosynthesis
METASHEGKDQLKLPGKVVIVLPTLDEEGGIGFVIDNISAQPRGYHFEVLVVDGGSRDRTVELATLKGAHVIPQRGNGYGAALQTGFNYACDKMNADILIMMDADGTYQAGDIPALLRPIVAGKAELVIGNRLAGLKEGSMTVRNRIGNTLLSLFGKWALRVNVSDTQSGFRALLADSWRRLDMKTTGMPFAVEMIAEAHEANCKMVEVPISYNARIGVSKLQPTQDAFRILATMLRLARDYRPLLFFGGLGALLIILAAAEGVTVVVEFLVTGTVKRIPSVVLSSTLMVTGFLVLTLGLIADMVKDVKRFVRKNP